MLFGFVLIILLNDSFYFICGSMIDRYCPVDHSNPSNRPAVDCMTPIISCKPISPGGAIA